jgi:hypothetical protein
MPAVSLGDYSKYPEPLRDLLPYLEGEVCDLRGCWQVFKHLFMANENRTRELGERLGGILGYFQGYLQDDMMIGIARLMDLDGAKQKNLTMWSLHERCQRWDPKVADEVKVALDALALHIADIRLHRHKRIAHFDLPVSLGHSKLLTVTFARMREAIEQMEGVLNLVTRRAVNTTTMFEMLDHRDITTAAEITVYKAMAYDVAVANGTMEQLAWRKHLF